LAAISQFLSIKAQEAFADAGVPEKRTSKVAFIPITLRDAEHHGAPLGFYIQIRASTSKS